MRTLTIAALAALSVTAANAADMPIKALPIAAPNWTGPYVGGNIGAGWFDPSFTTDIPSFPITPPKKPPVYTRDPLFGVSGGATAGIVGGVQGGYNWQFAPQWIAGIEGDFDVADFKSGASVAPLVIGGSATFNERVDWLASLRGRVGYLWTPTLLLYGTGGAAWADINYSATAQVTLSSSATTSFSDVRSGWVAGAGAEWMWNPNIVLRAEYLFYSFAGRDVSVPLSPAITATPVAFSWDRLSISVVRVGASYKF